MKSLRLIACLSITALTFVLQACGGGGGFLGGGDTNGTLTVGSTSSTVTAGRTVQVTATFTNTKGVLAVPITFTSSDPNVIANASAETNSVGVAVVQLSAVNIINADRIITITASTGSLVSSTQITVRANKLTVNAPAKVTFTQAAGSGMKYFIAGAGNLITYTDADGTAINGKQVEIKLDHVIGIDQANWVETLTTGTFNLTAPSPPHIFTLIGNVLPNSAINLDVTAPGLPAGTSSDYAAYFIATVREVGFTIDIPFNLQFTITSK